MSDNSSRLVPSRRLPLGLFGYNRADVRAYFVELEIAERSAVEVWTRAIELERESVARAQERAVTMRDLLRHLEQETASLEAQVATAKASSELMDVGAQHEISRLEQIYQLRREQLTQLVPAIDREWQKIDHGLRQLMSTIRETMLQTTSAMRPGVDHDSQFVAVAPLLFGSDLDASQVTAHPLAAGRTRLDVPMDRLRVQSRDGKLSGPVTGIVVSGLPPRVLGYVIGSTAETERAIAAEDVLAIGQHTVMVRPEARLMDLADLPEVPAGQALLAVNRVSAPDLESIGQAAAALSEAPAAPAESGLPPRPEPLLPAEPAPPLPPVAAEAEGPTAAPGGDVTDQTWPPVNAPEAGTRPGKEAPTGPAADWSAPPAAALAAQPVANNEGPARTAPPAEAPTPAAQSAGPPPAATPVAPPSLASPLSPPEQSAAAPPLPHPSVPTPLTPPSQPRQVAQAGGAGLGPTVSELAGLLPPPSWQVDVPVPVAGSDLLADAPEPPGWTPQVPPETYAAEAPAPIPAAPAAPAPPRPTPRPQPPTPAAPPPQPDMGGVSAGGAVDVLAFLEGKLVGQDIYNSAGELLAAKDMVIDAALVQRVDAAGRLPELIVYMTLPGLGAPPA